MFYLQGKMCLVTQGSWLNLLVSVVTFIITWPAVTFSISQSMVSKTIHMHFYDNFVFFAWYDT